MSSAVSLVSPPIIPVFIFFPPPSQICSLFPVRLVLVVANQFAAPRLQLVSLRAICFFPHHSFFVLFALCLIHHLALPLLRGWEVHFLRLSSCEGGQWIVVLLKSIEYSLGGGLASLWRWELKCVFRWMCVHGFLGSTFMQRGSQQCNLFPKIRVISDLFWSFFFPNLV